MRFSWVRLGWVRERGGKERGKEGREGGGITNRSCSHCRAVRRGLVVVEEEVMHSVILPHVGFLLIIYSK